MPLEGVAAEEWARMVGRLEESSCLSQMDDGVIYQYCCLFAETEALGRRQSEIDAGVGVLEENLGDGDVDKDDLVRLLMEIAGQRKLSASYDNKIRQGRMALRQYLVEFGLTPAARTRVKLPPKRGETKVEQFRRALTVA